MAGERVVIPGLDFQQTAALGHTLFSWCYSSAKECSLPAAREGTLAQDRTRPCSPIQHNGAGSRGNCRTPPELTLEGSAIVLFCGPQAAGGFPGSEGHHGRRSPIIKIIFCVDIAFFYRKANILCGWSKIQQGSYQNKGLWHCCCRAADLLHLEPWYQWFQVWLHYILILHEFISEFIVHEMKHMNSWSGNLIWVHDMNTYISKLAMT